MLLLYNQGTRHLQFPCCYHTSYFCWHVLTLEWISAPPHGASSLKAAAVACRYAAIMAPAILVLQRQLRHSFTAPPETPHEAQFRGRYQGLLRDACASLQAPDLTDVAGFEQAFEPIRAVTRAIGEDCRYTATSSLYLGYAHIFLHVDKRTAPQQV